MSDKKCSAKDPARCRYHGVNHMTAFIVNKMIEKEGNYGTPEEYYEIVKDMSRFIDEAGSKSDYVKDKRDVEGIINALSVQNYVTSVTTGDNRRSRTHDYFPIREIAQYVVFMKDKDAAALPAKNLLDRSLKASGAISNYEHALAKYMAEEGTPVASNASFLVWEDYHMERHIRGCKIAAVTDVKEDSWAEFNGTFNEDDPTVHGVSAHGQCACGFFKGEMRKEGQANKMMFDIINKYA